MAIRGQALTLTYTAWDSAAGAPKAGDAANHTLRLVRDGTESTPANAPAEVDAASAKGEYRLALTAAEMDVDFITLCGVSSTASIAIIPVKLATEDGDLAALAATLALIKASTDLITSVTVANGTASAGTVISGVAAYATAADLAARYDWRSLARLATDNDTGPLPTYAQFLVNTTVAALLMAASGRVERACFRGGRYTAADLQALASTNAGEDLADLVADLCVWRIYVRRPNLHDKMPPACTDALETLKALAAGEEIWPLQAVADAGRAAYSELTPADVERRDNQVTAQGRYRGLRSDQEWRPRPS